VNQFLAMRQGARHSNTRCAVHAMTRARGYRAGGESREGHEQPRRTPAARGGGSCRVAMSGLRWPRRLQRRASRGQSRSRSPPQASKPPRASRGRASHVPRRAGGGGRAPGNTPGRAPRAHQDAPGWSRGPTRHGRAQRAG
jgi:hypothetical protein